MTEFALIAKGGSYPGNFSGDAVKFRYYLDGNKYGRALDSTPDDVARSLAAEYAQEVGTVVQWCRIDPEQLAESWESVTPRITTYSSSAELEPWDG